MERNDLKAEVMDSIHKKVLDMLSLTEINENSNLVEAGLSSIMIMQVSYYFRKNGFKVPFSTLIEKPTLRDWADFIHSAEAKPSKEQQEKVTLNRSNPFDLTDVQYAYYIGRGDEQPLGGVGCHAYIEIDGALVDGRKLNTAWNTIQYYHPMLRAKFLPTGQQMIMPSPYSEEIGVFDFRELSQDAVESQLIILREALSHQKLMVELGEVAEISLAILPGGKTRIFFDVDLLVADVLSLSIIIRDLAEAYAGKKFIPQSSYTFHDYMEGKKNFKNESQLDQERKFWEEKMEQSTCCAPKLPLAKKPELIDRTRFSRRSNIVDKEIWSEIKRKCTRHTCTPSMFLLTCYALILERWCNQDSFWINIPLFDRNTEVAEAENMVADFTNLLLLDYCRRADEPFLDTMNRIKRTFLENVSHSGYSGVSVQREMFKLMGGTGFVAPVVFACNIDTPLETGLSREVFGDISYMVSQTPQVWLDFQTYIKDGSLILCWDAVDELYPDSLLDDMFNALVELIHTMARSENWSLVFDVLPKHQLERRKAELDKILPLQYPGKLLMTDFLKNIRMNPEKIAVIDGLAQEKISYRDLYAKAMAIADLLVKRGVQPGDYIGITLPRGCEQIYAMLGILFSGAVYVPIGVNQPEDRRRKIYRQIGIKGVVTDTKTWNSSLLVNEDILLLNINEIDTTVSLREPVLVSPKDSAYVIMTSGSTGIPKGVEICHESAVNTIDDINRSYHISSKDTVLMVSAIDFDLSVYDVFGMLSAGGKLVILDEAHYKDPALWLALIEKYEISIWNSVPMLFDMLVSMAEGKGTNINHIRLAMLSGDWIALDLPSRFYNRSENSIVAAMGGATEASIWSNYFIVPEEIPDNWISIPYGKALGNQIYRVMDGVGRICPDYVQGELWIGGVGVAKGYRGDEELTSRKFITDVVKWYKTGDMGMTWQDGTIEFWGRQDNQVKVKGHRVELGEIESAMEKTPAVAHCFVCVVEGAGEKQLAAYMVLKENMRLEQEELKGILAKLLPSYMIPEKYFFSNKIPLLENGKPNKKEIQRILNEQMDSEPAGILASPQNTLETEIEKIWRQVLNKKRPLSRFDNFFKLGGDSLKAVSIVTKMESIVNIPINISVTSLFQSPTIQQFASEIERLTSNYEVEVI